MSGRKLPWDWYDGELPPNVKIHEDAYVETSFSFRFFRSERSPGVESAVELRRISERCSMWVRRRA